MARTLLLLALASTLLATSLAAPNFCLSIVAGLGSCPSVDTVDLDISKYNGTWYSLGSNAQFAFSLFGGRGGQCQSAVYGPLPRAGGRNRVSVSNRALLVASLAREGRARAISSQAAATARGVRALCFRLVQDTATPTSVLDLTNTIRSETRNNAALTVLARNRIATQVVRIRTAVDRMSARAAEVFAALETVQSENGVLTGRTLPTTYVLSSTTRRIREQGERIQRLEDAMVAARREIFDSAQTISAIIGTRVISAAAAATALQTLTQTGVSPVASALQAINGGGAGIEREVRLVGSESPRSTVITVNGTATQDPVDFGELSVTFPPGLPAPYNIIKLDGAASSGYSTAIVWGCVPDANDLLAPYNYFYILSRNPRPDTSVIRSSLSFLRSKGIFFGGDNDFIRISQSVQLCRPVSAAIKASMRR